MQRVAISLEGDMKHRTNIGNLEKESDEKYPNWIPQEGEYYAWREHTTRRGKLMVGRVISFDGKIVHGREPIGCSERKYLRDIFKLDGDYSYLFKQ